MYKSLGVGSAAVGVRHVVGVGAGGEAANFTCGFSEFLRVGTRT